MDTVEEIKMQRITQESINTLRAYINSQDITDYQEIVIMIAIAGSLGAGVISANESVSIEIFIDAVRDAILDIED